MVNAWMMARAIAVTCTLVAAGLGCGELKQADLPETAGQGGTVSDTGDGTQPTGVPQMPTGGSGSADATGASNASVSDGVTAEGGEADAGGNTTIEDPTADPTTDATTDAPTDDSDASSTAGEACEPSGNGVWADCGAEQSCESAAEACETLDDGASCSFDCVTPCDCPPAPSGVGGTAVVACEDFSGPEGQPDGVNDCYLSCEQGEMCPAGMQCIDDFQCMYPGSDGVGNYEGCDLGDNLCPDGAVCVVVEPSGNTTCLPTECEQDSDCPAVPGGTVACGYIFPGGGAECYLDCGGPLECPEAWTCGGIVCAQSVP